MHTETVTRDGVVVRYIESVPGVDVTVFLDAYDSVWHWVVEEPFLLDGKRIEGGESNFETAVKEARWAARNMCAEAGINVPDSWVPSSEASRTRAPH